MVKIGLEIHSYLNTQEKLFCSCKAEHGLKHTKPNVNICPVCTGQPGAKPMLPNTEAIKKSIQVALILGCKINTNLTWQRKHYDWPDLPKGYQNTLSGPYATPTGEKGKYFGVRIRECHLEEDPAKWDPKKGTLDYNRSGVPLIEIVTEPDFKNSEEVVEWLRNILTTLTYIKAIDKNLGIKADVNVSVENGERVEIKNVNSIKNIKKALDYEIKRQEKYPPKSQETRMFDEITDQTRLMRLKEHAEDYRFISDPDLPELELEKNFIEEIKKTLPETPFLKLEKLIEKYKIEKKYAEVLTKKIELTELFEKIIDETNPKLAVRWISEELLSVLNYNKIELEDMNLNHEHFIELLKLIEDKKLTELKAKEILRSWTKSSFSPLNKIKEFSEISDKKQLEEIVLKVIKQNPKAVEDYKKGNKNALNFLIGQVMRQTKNRADYSAVKKILGKKL